MNYGFIDENALIQTLMCSMYAAQFVLPSCFECTEELVLGDAPHVGSEILPLF